MFTGIIYYIGRVTQLDGNLLGIYTTLMDIKVGQSIAVNGCCLTIINIEENNIYFNIMEETFKRTTFSSLKIDQEVHVEQGMNRFDRYDGHILTGHISGVIYLISREKSNDNTLILTFSLQDAASFLSYKDSIAIDGVSLTVSKVLNDSFTVNLIPSRPPPSSPGRDTQENTLLAKKNIGNAFNVEFSKISPDLSHKLSLHPLPSIDYIGVFDTLCC
jgi:riboflavin synthase